MTELLKKPLSLAAISGLLLAFGWPVYGCPLLLFIGLIPLLLAEKKIAHNGKKSQN